jgi:hypothetical protein
MADVTMSFVVRLTRDETGRLTGVVQQVKTGLKVRVDGFEAIGQTIGEMFGASATEEARDL